jgi:riboflavin biosynthesis pyrimidine reductase
VGDDLRRLSDGGARTVRDLVASLELRDAAFAGDHGRPRVVADMVATADGRASVQGRSVALGHPADRALLRELRTAADAILVGSGTLVAERYADLLDDEQRARRVAEGRSEHPLVVTLSRRLLLPSAQDVPLFAEAGVPILVATQAGEETPPPAMAADLEILRVMPGTPLLATALAELGARGIRGVLCEGGPTLLRELVVADCVDDLLLTVAPMLVAGDAPTLLRGPELEPPAGLALRTIHRADDHLFLHYTLPPPAPASGAQPPGGGTPWA